MTHEHLLPDSAGLIHIPTGVGLGITPNLAGIAPYVVDCDIQVAGKSVYRTPALRA
jgi:hypothetical protein